MADQVARRLDQFKPELVRRSPITSNISGLCSITTAAN